MTYFKPSIITYSSIGDCKMICDELKIDLSVLEINQEQMDLIIQVLEGKKKEIEERYCK